MKILYVGVRLESYLALKRIGYDPDVFTFEDTVLFQSGSLNKNNVYLSDRIKSKSLDSLLRILQENEYDYVVSVGYPYILDNRILSITGPRFLNLHPHLTQKWKGYNVIKDSYKMGETEYGATLHFLTNNVDAGEIIYQDSLTLKKKNIEQIYETVFAIVEPYVLAKGITILNN